MKLTERQQQAVRATGHSVIVSAAAGAGKTSVLAERCAYLVCTAPKEHRCDASELLVLTFTEAAAAEMRGRIAAALRKKAQESPGNARLRQQASLVDAAQISTIHSFCGWIVRRWFNEAEIDPGFVQLDEDEATLLKHEVRDAMFDRLYGHGDDNDKLLERSSESHISGFVKLVDDYGLGNDNQIGEQVIKIANFVESLPDPASWLARARARFSGDRETVVLELACDLGNELARQEVYCRNIARSIMSGHEAGHFHGQHIQDYADALSQLHEALSPQDDAYDSALLSRFEKTRQALQAYEFPGGRAPKIDKDDEEAVSIRDAASKKRSAIKSKLFKDRLFEKYGRFSTNEWLEGLKKIEPYANTLLLAVEQYQSDYSARKRQKNSLDFSDLERFAFNLLTVNGDANAPSPIACSLQKRFSHVLVDEFQDINPIQQAIIRLASRETSNDHEDNLFVVGDVKQSIYRFRLAEPSLFTNRFESSLDPSTASEAISLQANFRSRTEVLDSVNLLFSRLMKKELGGIGYDELAVLKAGRADASHPPRVPVEVHLIERNVSDSAEDEDEPEENARFDPLDPVHWDTAQREAYQIGRSIQRIMESGEVRHDGREISYGDMAILLRAASVNANKISSVLTSMGIPNHASVGGSLLAALEVRDVLALLEVIDNLQQDIPLASVLRSGVAGHKISEDDLVEIRCLDREIPFHEALRAYSERGPNEAVRERVQTILYTIERYREKARHRPLAELLWSIYSETGYLAYVGGLPGGRQRTANLTALHDLARKFSTFRKQGIHRFLQFIEHMDREKQTLSAATAQSESDDAVSIMSIHYSKGLEFPVVFLAGLGKKFNLGDRAGNIIFEREGGLGMSVVDPDRMIKYPSASHLRVSAEIEQHTRAEELRILYVAMTRARDKLIMTGSLPGLDSRVQSELSAAQGPSIPELQLVRANTALDWVLPALAAADAGQVSWLSERPAPEPTVEVHTHDEADILSWKMPALTGKDQDKTRGLVSTGDPLPPEEPRLPGDCEVEEVLSRMDYLYPNLAATSVPAVIAASEFRRESNSAVYDSQHGVSPSTTPPMPIPASKYTAKIESDAVTRGIITHKALQNLDFESATGPASVASELLRMVKDGILQEGDLEFVDRPGIEWFVGTSLAESIRAAKDGYLREFPFVALEDADWIDPTAGELPDNRVLVRGIVDGLIQTDDRLEVIDFKTDYVSQEDVPSRCVRYGSQVSLYARAMERIWRRPIDACWLVFLTPRCVEPVLVHESP